MQIPRQMKVILGYIMLIAVFIFLAFMREPKSDILAEIGIFIITILIWTSAFSIIMRNHRIRFQNNLSIPVAMKKNFRIFLKIACISSWTIPLFVDNLSTWDACLIGYLSVALWPSDDSDPAKKDELPSESAYSRIDRH